MKKVITFTAITLLILFGGCSGSSNNKPNYDVVSNNVTMWQDTTGERYIILALEVTNITHSSLHFKDSDFDIVDGNGNIIDNLKSISAYPSVVGPNETVVYYGAKISDKINDKNNQLKAVQHIESEKSHNNINALCINGITGGGNTFVTGIVKNGSSRTGYNNVKIAVVARTQSNKVVSVMKTTINSIKPHQEIEFKAEDYLIQRDLGSDIVTTYQNFAYIDPLSEPN